MDDQLKSNVRAYVARNELKKALTQLQQFATTANRPQLIKEVTLLLGKLKQAETEEMRGTSSKESLNIIRSQIAYATLNLVDNNSAASANQPVQNTSDSTSKASNNKLFIAGLSLIGLVFLTTFLLPCPNDIQYATFRTILSIGVAGIAALLPGFFNFKYKNMVSAGGALGVFALVYMFNPALTNSLKTCNSLDYSILLVPQSKTVEFGGDKQQLKLYLGNDIRTESISKKGIADYKNIPTEYRDQEISIELNLRGWQFAQSQSKRIAFKMDGNYREFEIEPDNSLAQLFGQIQDDEDNLVAGAQVSVKGGKVLQESDEYGRFELAIPADLQEKEQRLMVRKAGYEVWDNTVYPGLKQELMIQLKKK